MYVRIILQEGFRIHIYSVIVIHGQHLSALSEILRRATSLVSSIVFSFSNYLFCLLCKLFWIRGLRAGRTVMLSCCVPRKSVGEKFDLHHEQSEDYPPSSRHLAYYISSAFILDITSLAYLYVFIVYQY